MTLVIKLKNKIDELLLVLISLFIVFYYVFLSTVNANTLTTLSTFLDDSRPSATAVNYTNRFSNISSGTSIQCIKIKFSDASSGGNKPAGMDISTATLNTGSSTFMAPWTGWSATPNNGTGVIQITHATGTTPSGASDKTIIISSITNGSIVNVNYYMQISTYTNNDCTTGPTDNGVSAFIFNDGILVTASVEPTITLTVSSVNSGNNVNGEPINITTTGTTVPFGLVTSNSKKVAAHDISVSTNSVSGYTVSTRYSGPLTNGVVNWTNHTGSNAVPTAFPAAGTEAWGYTTEDVTLQNLAINRFDPNKWAGYTTTPLEVAYNGGAVASQITRVGYQIGAAGNTQTGSYSTTVIYIATPVY